MSSLGIIQPGRIGDIVIMLPIAKWYSDRGHNIIWPIASEYLDNFIGYVDYVKFFPISFDCNEARRCCIEQNCNTIVDTSFCMEGGNVSNEIYYKTNNIPFDEVKYNLANVPFSEKWNLCITRDTVAEQNLFNNLVKTDYIVKHLQSSDTYKDIDIPNPNDYQVIEITPKTKSIFDWLTIIENAKQLFLFDSCIANMVEQLNVKTKKTYIQKRTSFVENPTIKNFCNVIK
jgi:hypothetical protein